MQCDIRCNEKLPPYPPVHYMFLFSSQETKRIMASPVYFVVQNGKAVPLSVVSQPATENRASTSRPPSQRSETRPAAEVLSPRPSRDKGISRCSRSSSPSLMSRSSRERTPRSFRRRHRSPHSRSPQSKSRRSRPHRSRSRRSSSSRSRSQESPQPTTRRSCSRRRRRHRCRRSRSQSSSSSGSSEKHRHRVPISYDVAFSPGDVAVRRSVLKAIKRGEYVDYRKLLDPKTEDGETFRIGSDGCLVRSDAKSPLTLSQWNIAHSKYIRILCKTGHSINLASQLLAYQEIINKISLDSGWPVAAKYDQQFRAAKATRGSESKYHWDDIHTTTYSLLTASRPAIPSRLSIPKPANASEKPFRKYPCWDFATPAGCKRVPCKFLHKCPCGQFHRSKMCSNARL